MEPAELFNSISHQWTSLSGIYTDEESHFMNHFLCNNANAKCSLPHNLYQSAPHEYAQAQAQPPLPISTSSDASCFNNTPLTNFAYISSGLSVTHSKFTPYTRQPHQQLLPHNNLQTQIKEHEILVSQTQEEDKTTSTGKRSRNSNEVPKNKRNVKCRKSCASISTEDQTLSTCCSEDESNSSHELRRVASSSSLSQNESTDLMLSGKSRSSRGPATDPQSLYARKRRERINERLRILQSLVPNGTKVDISTMLEEAVQYVKFLQLQIKLLSSDDLWMYSPIAYNGINIGLELGITPTKETKDMHSIEIKENAAV